MYPNTTPEAERVHTESPDPTDTSTAVKGEDGDLYERAKQHVLNCKREALTYYEGQFKKFNYFSRLYIKGGAKTNVPYGRANLKLPQAFQQVEPFVDLLSEVMLGEEPYIKYTGRALEDEPVAEEITDFTQYQLETGNYVTELQKWIRNLGTYGTAVFKVLWENDIEEIEYEEDEIVMEPEMVPNPQNPGEMVPTGRSVPKMETDPDTGIQKPVTRVIVKKEDYVKHDGPRFLNVPLHDFFVPRSADSADVQRMAWVCHREYASLNKLLKNPNYKRIHPKLQAILKNQEISEDDLLNSTSTIREEAARVAQEQKNPSKGSKKFEGKVEVLEWFGNFDPKKGELEEPFVITLVLVNDEELVARAEPNPLKFKFKPFLMSNDYPIQGEPYGYGELDHIQGLIEESSALRNARLDIANISLNRCWLVERQAGVNLRELYTAPDKVILTNDNNGIKPLDMGSVTPASVQELARIDFDIQNTTDMVNPRQDVATVGQAFGNTATGINFLASRGNSRLRTKLRHLDDTFFKPLALMLNWYNRDVVTDDIYFKINRSDISNPYRVMTPEKLATPVCYKAQFAPSKLSIQEQKQNIAYMLQVIAQVEKVAPGTNNLIELLKVVYKLYGFPHPEKYVQKKPTVVLQGPNGLVDAQGGPVQVVPVDAQGKPITPQGMSPAG